MEDQPLPANASPTTLSPGYVVDSDLKKDEKDPKEDPADYPVDRGDNDNDESSNDDNDDDDVEKDEEDKEEEEHLALADPSDVSTDDLDEKDPKEDPTDYPTDRGNNDEDKSSNDDDDDDDVEKDEEDKEEEEHLAPADPSDVSTDNLEMMTTVNQGMSVEEIERIVAQRVTNAIEAIPIYETKTNLASKLMSQTERQEEKNDKKTFQRSRDEKNSKSDRKCFRCGNLDHLIRECLKPPKDKNQRAFVGGSWNDSGEEDDEKAKNETCLVAQQSIDNKANKSAGLKEANNSVGTQANDDQGANSEEIDLHEEHFVLPIWSAYSTTVKSLGDNIEKNTDFNTREKLVSRVEQIFLEELEKIKRQEKEANDVAKSLRKEATHDIQNAHTSSTNLLNIVSTPLSTAGPSRAFNDGELSYPNDPSMPYLEDIYASPSEGIFTDLSYDNEGVVTDFNNLETTVNVSLTPTTRIHTIHPKTQILGDPMSAVQIRSKVNKSSKAHALSALLYGTIDEEVYVTQPLGFVDPKFPNKDTPKTSHLHAVKRIFRYLKGQPKLDLWYPKVSSFDLEAYSDSDYVGANLDRKSTTIGYQFLGRRLILWQCKK
nr:putative ribonuclease H-like domain-containing protein [Tanacetum cinerariifolium]